jgi:hypothetical protein
MFMRALYKEVRNCLCDSTTEVSGIITRNLSCVFIEYDPELVQTIFPLMSSLYEYYTSCFVLEPWYTAAFT